VIKKGSHESKSVLVPHLFADMSSTNSLDTLATLVGRLGRECPWTKSQNTADMLYWTRKECLEVEDVLRTKEVDGDELTKELGDVLFDVLMMIEVSGRDRPAITLESCAASACSKLKRRSPYLFYGSVPATVEEAEAAWQAGKQLEQAEAGAQPMPPPASPASHQPPLIQAPPSALVEPVPMPVPERQGQQQQLAEAAPGSARQRQQQPAAPASRGGRLVTTGAAARSVGTGSTISLLAGAMPLSHGEDEDEDGDEDGDEDVGLTEWERDFRRGAGPPSESEDEDDEAIH
jgi:NTP pyrophosphatase (non-canonical NTP hydrolase)